MSAHTPEFMVKLADNEAELLSAQRLRYSVFVQELGGSGPLVDHEAQLEKDQFDPYFDHLILKDLALDVTPTEQVVGVYRVLRDDAAAKIGRLPERKVAWLRHMTGCGPRNAALRTDHERLHHVQTAAGGAPAFPEPWQAVVLAARFPRRSRLTCCSV